MRGRPFEKASAVFNKKDDYFIIAYRYRINIQDGEHDRGEEYLILDDDFKLHYFEKKRIYFADNEKSSFIEVKPIDDYYKFFIDNDFINVFEKSLSKDSDLDFSGEIWDRTWLAKCLLNKNVKLNRELEEALYDEKYKLTLILGFLDFANEYINFEHGTNSDFEIDFCKEKKNKSYLRFEENNFEQITDNMEHYLINKIRYFLFGDKKIKNNYGIVSDKLSRKLYLMIDCIFIDKPNAIYNHNEGGWSNLTIFDYKDSYYILNLRENN
ncbi:MAG: hypothetical protein BM557_07070 [Flavobacterium sp. MedPE-SWcel]|uniref:hypothetical protein n=1 Tax=uncultured Flavobacterium sp. TaxID=165435 RepID=UPI00091E50A8|nr:hypothetical protein [uncultured Flavobacterium sp.]OIQ18675.1 MAG: hypothetical protein BM557_07070 [Flavobacterium sp. MedPE-SWcel]